MLTAADLARLKIKRAVFHDVPDHPKAVETNPVLADLEMKIDAGKARILYGRITQVLGSKHAYGMRFSAAPSTIITYLRKSGLSQAKSILLCPETDQ
jgi:hypothetical protein